MRLLLLDYGHGWLPGEGATGDVVVRRWTDGVPLHEEDALLILGTALERQLSEKADLAQPSELALTRPDASHVSEHNRWRVANQYAGLPGVRLVSIHAHRGRKPGKKRPYRTWAPRSGPEPDDARAASPAEAEQIRQWRGMANIQGFSTHVGALSAKLAQRLLTPFERPMVVDRMGISEWWGGGHVQAFARRMFRQVLIPCTVVELFLGETDEEVRKTIERKGEAVEALADALAGEVGWQT